MKTVKLTNYEIDIKSSLTWGDKEQVQQEYMKGMKIKGTPQKGKNVPFDFDPTVTSKAKYKLLEVAIKEIRKGDKKIKFSKDWMYDLPAEDGDKLYEEVDKLYSSKKK